MIKNLIFDFGKVLVDYDFERFFRSYIPDESRLKALAHLLNTEKLQDELDRESLPFDVIMDNLIRKYPDFEYEIQYFNTHYPELVTGEVVGMSELIQKLKKEGFNIYGLTNWCSKVYCTMRQFPIFNHLDGYVISSEVHYIKPEPEIYRHLLNTYNLKAEECVFTDDKPVNIKGGRQLGIQGIVFLNTAQYEKDLREIISSKSNL